MKRLSILPLLFVAILFASESYAEQEFTMLLNRPDCITVAIPGEPGESNLSKLICPKTCPGIEVMDANTFELENGQTFRAFYIVDCDGTRHSVVVPVNTVSP